MSSLFSPSLLPLPHPLLPTELLIRPLEKEDIKKGFLDVLNELSQVDNVSAEMFVETFDEMKNNGSYYIIVIESIQTSNIVAAASLILERKFLHGCGKAGHIEDVVVFKSQRGLQLGLILVETLKNLGNSLGCYKIILNCHEGNVKFYEKCGFSLHELQMAVYNIPLVKKHE